MGNCEGTKNSVKNKNEPYKIENKTINLNTTNENEKINECDTKHAPLITESSSEILYNSIVRINISNKLEGTGFFIKFKIKGKQIKCLLTCNHVINDEYINSKEIIDIYYGKVNQEINKKIKLDKNIRLIKTYKAPIDITLIQIIKSDNIPEDKYLFPDYNYKNGFEFYNNKNNNFYMAGYPKIGGKKAERAISSGKIRNIDKFEFEHTLDSRYCSSGSPICLIENNCVVGIHKQGNLKKSINYGTFIGIIMNDFENYKQNEEHSFHFSNIKKESEIINREVISNICLLDNKDISKDKFIIVASIHEINIYFLESKKLKFKIQLPNPLNILYIGTDINTNDAYPIEDFRFNKLEIVDKKYYEKLIPNSFLLIKSRFKIEVNLEKNKAKILETLDDFGDIFKKRFSEKILATAYISNLDIFVVSESKLFDIYNNIYFFKKDFKLIKRYENMFWIKRIFDNNKCFVTYSYMRDGSTSSVYDINDNYKKLYEKQCYHLGNLSFIDNNRFLVIPLEGCAYTFLNLENFSEKMIFRNYEHFNDRKMIVHKLKDKKYLQCHINDCGGKKENFEIIEEKREGEFTVIEESKDNNILGNNLLFFNNNFIISWNDGENIINFLIY